MTLGRNDAFSVVGGMPAARFVEGHVSRINSSTVPPQVFITAPTFDAGAEFGPVRYSGAPPPVATGVIVAVVTGTTEAWIVSADLPAPDLVIDPWHVVGAVGEPAFLNGYAFYGGPFVPPRFRIDPFGKVTITGLLTGSAASNVFQLPVGYRPDTENIFIVKANIGAVELGARIDVLPTGMVNVGTAGTVSYLSLDGVEFYVSTPPSRIFQGPQGPQGPIGQTGVGQLLMPTAKSGAYTAASNDYVLMTGSATVTLPAPIAGRIVGVKSVSGASWVFPAQVTTPSGVIFGPGAGGASIPLGAPGAFVTLLADGTNWHIVDGALDSGWIPVGGAGAPAFANGWVNGGIGFQPMQYRKQGTALFIRGYIINGTNAAPAFVLPAGFRTAYTIIDAALNGSTIAYTQIDTAGNVIPVSSTLSIHIDTTLDLLA